MAIIATASANSQGIVTGITSNVAQFQNCYTNTFRITNASSSVYAYVGVFNSNVATTFNHPTAGGTSGQGVVLVPNESLTISGDFGIHALPGNVWVAAITATGSTTVFATPVAPGSF